MRLTTVESTPEPNLPTCAVSSPAIAVCNCGSAAARSASAV